MSKEQTWTIYYEIIAWQSDIPLEGDIGIPDMMQELIVDYDLRGMAEDCAESCAEDYYLDGNVMSEGWPIQVALYDKKGLCLGTYAVTLDESPTFHAYRA